MEQVMEDDAKRGKPRALTPEIYERLREPFPVSVVEVKPGMVVDDRQKPGQKRAMAIPYVRWTAYVERLNEVVGADGWDLELTEIVPGQYVKARLTILGAVRENLGDAEEDTNPKKRAKGPNPAFEASSQAFRRA